MMSTLADVMQFIDGADTKTVVLIGSRVEARTHTIHADHVLQKLPGECPVLVACGSLKYDLAMKNGYYMSLHTDARFTTVRAIDIEGDEHGDTTVNCYYDGEGDWLNVEDLGRFRRDSVLEAIKSELDFTRDLESGTVAELADKCGSSSPRYNDSGTCRSEDVEHGVVVVLGPPDLEELATKWIGRVVPEFSSEYRAAAANGFALSDCVTAEFHVNQSTKHHGFVDRWHDWETCGVSEKQMLEFVGSCIAGGYWFQELVSEYDSYGVDSDGDMECVVAIIKGASARGVKRPRIT